MSNLKRNFHLKTDFTIFRIELDFRSDSRVLSNYHTLRAYDRSISLSTPVRSNMGQVGCQKQSKNKHRRQDNHCDETQWRSALYPADLSLKSWRDYTEKRKQNKLFIDFLSHTPPVTVFSMPSHSTGGGYSLLSACPSFALAMRGRVEALSKYNGDEANWWKSSSSP